MKLRARTLTLFVVDAAGVATALVMMLPFLHFAYRSIALRATVETAAAVIALVAAILVFGRYRNSGRADELALVAGLALLAGSNFLFSALPWALLSGTSMRFSTWTTLVCSLVGAGLLATAALLPSIRVTRRTATGALAAVGLFAVGVAAIVAVYASKLPLGIDPAQSPPPAGPPWPVGARSVLLAQFAGAIIFGVASYGFTRRAERTKDELLSWLGASAALAAFARINYTFFPSLYSEWFYVGDLMRLASYVLILVGAAREISRYQHGIAGVAVIEERRRVARDLHDGLAQELAFIATRSRAIVTARAATVDELAALAAAAERALDESRRAIATLTHSVDEPLDVALVQTVEEIASRTGARTRLDIAPEVDVGPVLREALLRIVREAVTNASRHGQARTIEVQLSNGDGLRLRVVDDGVGFDTTAAARANGFGLVTMRERARAIGGALTIESHPRAGTAVEVTVP